jgi:TonB family protein
MTVIRIVLLSAAVCLVLAAISSGQTVAVLAPEANDVGRLFSEAFTSSLSSSGVKVLDQDLVSAAYRSAAPANPFNMSRDESRRLGEVLGCRYIILLRSGSIRRTSLERGEYWEAFAAVYLVSTRTGRLVSWSLEKRESGSGDDSVKLLLETAPARASATKEKIFEAEREGRDSERVSVLKTPDDFAGTKDFRPPVPYNRIKPEYTQTAYLYGAEGTVDIEVDIDETGRILRTDITRWLGYGLDEAVIKAVREMNWRPAEIGGKPLPMRVLLRYNFKKIEKD